MTNSIITDSLTDCPYNAQNCPKVDTVKDDVDKIIQKLDNLTRIIYILIGVILCEFGVLVI